MYLNERFAVTATIDSPNESSRTWMVDVATHRIVRKGRVATPARRDGGEGMATNDLNPLEDVKGAAKYVEGLHPLKAIKEALETGAELIEPAEADLRAMEIEQDTVSERPADEAGDARRPSEAHAHPDSRELGREHPRL